MKCRRQNGATLNLLTPLAAPGGEGTVYEVPGEIALAAKIYDKPSDERGRKLAAMIARPPLSGGAKNFVTWPQEILQDEEGLQTVGFLMPRVQQTLPLFLVYNPAERQKRWPLFNYRYLHYAAHNLTVVFEVLHRHGIVIGDVNESNVLVAPSGRITLIDADSFQVPAPDGGEQFRCTVGTPLFVPPELEGRPLAEADRTQEQDRYGLAVLLFRILMEGFFPFPCSERPRLFPYGTERPPDFPERLPLSLLHRDLRALFMRCFEPGLSNPQERPTAEEWCLALKRAIEDLGECTENPQHRYGRHLPTCPWCRMARETGIDPFPCKPPQPPAAQPLPTPAASVPTAAPQPASTPVVATLPPALVQPWSPAPSLLIVRSLPGVGPVTSIAAPSHPAPLLPHPTSSGPNSTSAPTVLATIQRPVVPAVPMPAVVPAAAAAPKSSLWQSLRLLALLCLLLFGLLGWRGVQRQWPFEGSAQPSRPSIPGATGAASTREMPQPVRSAGEGVR